MGKRPARSCWKHITRVCGHWASAPKMQPTALRCRAAKGLLLPILPTATLRPSKSDSGKWRRTPELDTMLPGAPGARVPQCNKALAFYSGWAWRQLLSGCSFTPPPTSPPPLLSPSPLPRTLLPLHPRRTSFPSVAFYSTLNCSQSALYLSLK